jgi:large subunit ribosomal protein L5
MSRLQTYYKETVVPQLMEQLKLSNVMEVPKITKITLNMGVGEATTDKKVMARATEDMAAIAGQKPIVTMSRKSVASFKIRDGWPVGCKVTLRREKMYEFLDRLVNVSIPRIAGADRVPGDRFRQGRRHARHGHHHHDNRTERR